MAVVCMRNGVAEAATEMTSSPESHVEALRTAAKRTGGSASVQNGLMVAQRALSGAPPYAKREAVLLLAAITSCDPGDIKSTIGDTKKERIACSVVGAAAEVYLFKMLAKDTGGTYFVAKDETHFQQLVMAHATPPPAAPDEVACLVRMAFPRRNAADSLGLFGRDATQRRTGLKRGGYTCPQCKARVKELPAKCSVCEMTLISAPDLARENPWPSVVLDAPGNCVDRRTGASLCGATDARTASASNAMCKYTNSCLCVRDANRESESGTDAKTRRVLQVAPETTGVVRRATVLWIQLDGHHSSGWNSYAADCIRYKGN
eukprot:scaffold148_cov341-Pavlova_lutheri.AAC.35